MSRSSRVWNGRIAGLPSALVVLCGITYDRIKDRLSTVFWRGNLKEMNQGATIQFGVTVRYPGNITLGERSSLCRGIEISSERADSMCHIGNDSQIGRNVRLDFTGGLCIGKSVVISDRTVIFTHSHGTDPRSVPAKTPLKIGDRVWIGADALIVEWVSVIGDGAVVAAGAIVTKEVPPGVLVAGVPARVIRVLQ